MDLGVTLLMAGAVERRQFVGAANGVTPDMLAHINWNDKSTRTGMILAINNASILLIVIFVSVRLVVRRVMTRQFFLDDALVVLASAFTLGLCATSLLAMKYGFGQHVWNLDTATVLEKIKKCVQLMFIATIFYSCAITFTKLSIISSYLRIFPYNTLRIAMYITAVVTVGLFVASIPATIFQCTPVAAAWNFEDREATCYRFVNFLYANSAINVTTDLVLCTAPLPYFWRLQLARKQKIIVTLLFAIGGLACVASIIRLTYLYLLADAIDVSWHLAPSVLWTIAECSIGICCVSVPPMRPLLSKLLPDIFETRRAPYVRTSDGGGGTPRRHTYAMRSWSQGGTPTGPEHKASETDLTASSEEQVPATWLETAEEHQSASKAGTALGLRPTIRMCDAEDAIREPNPALQKT